MVVDPAQSCRWFRCHREAGGVEAPCCCRCGKGGGCPSIWTPCTRVSSPMPSGPGNGYVAERTGQGVAKRCRPECWSAIHPTARWAHLLRDIRVAMGRGVVAAKVATIQETGLGAEALAIAGISRASCAGIEHSSWPNRRASFAQPASQVSNNYREQDHLRSGSSKSLRCQAPLTLKPAPARGAARSKERPGNPAPPAQAP